MDNSNPDPAKVAAIAREFERLFGNELDPCSPEPEFYLLPLANEDETLEFLRSLPVGTRRDELGGILSAWRVEHLH